MRQLFDEIEPFDAGYVKVSDIHSLYYEQVGNPDGKPILFLHGGPGAGIDENCRRFFDPKFYRIILFDQRGCGKSRPFAELQENTTWDLIKDIERIREHLDVDDWVVFGGSWGATLSLIYGIKHPERIKGLILRGIWLSRETEIDWCFRGGAKRFFPEAWDGFIAPLKNPDKESIIQQYYDIFTGSDQLAKEIAAKGWSVWEASISKLVQSQDLIEEFSDFHKSTSIAMIECHYFINNMFGESENYILENIEKIAHTPTYIVNGRYDMVCPVESAYELYKALDNATFETTITGHSSSEPEIIDRLINATEQFKKLFN